MRISRKNLGLIEVPAPPKAEQQSVISKLDELRAETDRLRDIELAKISAFCALKQSLLEEAFAGKLTLRPVETIAA